MVWGTPWLAHQHICSRPHGDCCTWGMRESWQTGKQTKSILDLEVRLWSSPTIFFSTLLLPLSSSFLWPWLYIVQLLLHTRSSLPHNTVQPSANGATFPLPLKALVHSSPNGATFPLPLKALVHSSPNGATFPLPLKALVHSSPNGATFPLPLKALVHSSPNGATFPLPLKVLVVFSKWCYLSLAFEGASSVLQMVLPFPCLWRC